MQSKEQQSIKHFLRRYFLRKSLYYSVLWFFLSGFVALSITLFNLIALPPFEVLKLTIIGSGCISLAALLLWPIRFFIQASTLSFRSNEQLAHLVSQYDDNTYTRVLELTQDDNKVGQWSAAKIGREIPQLLTIAAHNLKAQYTFGRLLILITVLLLITGIFRQGVQSSAQELLSGELRSSFRSQTIPQEQIVAYGSSWSPDVLIAQGFTPSTGLSGFEVYRDTIISWSYKGRVAGNTQIKCDSLVVLNTWQAEVEPPSYTKMAAYVESDTIRAFLGSTVELKTSGLLVDLLQPRVPRETKSTDHIFVLNSVNDIELIFKDQLFKFPVELLEDKRPIINITDLSRDSVSLELSDDFSITRYSIDNQITYASASSLALELVWQKDEYKIKVVDNNNQSTELIVKRPALSKESNLALAGSQVTTVPSTLNSESKKKNLSSTEPREVQEQEKKREDKVPLKELLPEEPKELEDLDKLEAELDKLWKIEQLSNLLDEVSEEGNSALDSAISEVSEELESEDNEEGLQEALDIIEEMDASGEERQEQAKESAEKLKDLLNNEVAELLEDNVERLKRLLKSGLFLSVFQESLAQDLEIKDVKEQRNLVLLQEYLRDSLDVLIVSDPNLSKALTTQRELINESLIEFNAASISGSGLATSGYMVTALNELDKVLYLILESEKSNLSAAQKKCKKGRPGKDGKPSLGKGSKGKKGDQPKGSKPNGRKEGQKGKTGSKEGKEGQEGATGKGTKESLKAIDDAIAEGKKAGLGKETIEELEQLKRDLLLQGSEGEKVNEEFEKRLWETLESVFEKEKQGDDRKSDEAIDTPMQEGIEIKQKVNISNKTSLPLPILKK